MLLAVSISSNGYIVGANFTNESRIKRRNNNETLRLMLEWGCDPVWIYEEDGITSSPGLPCELENNKELVDLMNKISNEFDSQYVNTEREFSDVGFKTEAEKRNSSKTSYASQL